jgi:hypothetical protein
VNEASICSSRLAFDPFELHLPCQTSGGPIDSQIAKWKPCKEKGSARSTVLPIMVVISVSRLTLVIDVRKETRLDGLLSHHLLPYPVSCSPTNHECRRVTVFGHFQEVESPY